jgi:hypothetical protein
VLFDLLKFLKEALSANIGKPQALVWRPPRPWSRDCSRQELSGGVACLIGRGGLLWQRQLALVVARTPKST